jgi:AcrR family transcriptional regulator
MSAQTTRSQQRAQTRERLFDAAIEEFLAAGFSSARIERIVERVGVARGTFYFHFPTKDHVLYELTDRMEVMVADGVEFPEDAPLADVLRQVIAIMRGSGDTMDAELQREMLAAQLRRPDRDTTPPLLAKLSNAIDRAKARGDVRTELDAEDIGLSLLTSIFGVVALLQHEPDRDKPLDVLLEIFLRGVLTPEPARGQVEPTGSDTRAA